MIRRTALLLLIVGGLGPSFRLLANDGVDRYEGYYPTVFYHLYAPISARAGFTVLEEDMEGGADAAPAFRWARQLAIAFTKIAAYETCEELGESEYPMAIFDFSSENGDTPIQWTADKPARGRHPGGSHDGGINLDYGYYMTGYKGIHEDPDYSVCDDHYSETEKDGDGNPKDLNQCAGPANRLDVPRQAYFFLRLFRMHREEFNSLFLEQIGVDSYVKRAVLDQIGRWKTDEIYDISDELVHEMESIFTCDRWGGWARYHHHHCHVRLSNLDESGQLRYLIEHLLERERAIDYALLRAEFPDQTLFLKANLLSYKLSRALDVSLLGLENTGVTQCQYRLGETGWVQADEPVNQFRYVFDLPYGPQLLDEKAVVSARIVFDDGSSTVISTSVHLPQQDPLLKIRVARAAVSGHYEIETKGDDSIWKLWIDAPPIYSHFITGIDYQIFPAAPDSTPIIVRGDSLDFNARFVGAEDQIFAIEAKVSISTRITYAIPIYVSRAH